MPILASYSRLRHRLSAQDRRQLFSPAPPAVSEGRGQSGEGRAKGIMERVTDVYLWGDRLALEEISETLDGMREGAIVALAVGSDCLEQMRDILMMFGWDVQFSEIMSDRSGVFLEAKRR